jgi:hypothetical protein
MDTRVYASLAPSQGKERVDKLKKFLTRALERDMDY